MVQRTTIVALAGHKISGEPVTEEILVDDVGDGCWCLVASPGLVLGIAAGDIFRLGTDGVPIVVERGGNLAIPLLQDAASVSGGTMRTVIVRNPVSSRAAEQETPAYLCGRCRRWLDGLGIGSR